MRLGLYPADLDAGSIVREPTAWPGWRRRHRHRYEVNNDYREQLEAAGLVFSGTNPDLDSSSSSSCHATCTPTTSRRRPTPSCAPGRPGHTRSSPVSSVRRWTVGEIRALPDRRVRPAPRAGG